MQGTRHTVRSVGSNITENRGRSWSPPDGVWSRGGLDTLQLLPVGFYWGRGKREAWKTGISLCYSGDSGDMRRQAATGGSGDRSLSQMAKWRRAALVSWSSCHHGGSSSHSPFPPQSSGALEHENPRRRYENDGNPTRLESGCLVSCLNIQLTWLVSNPPFRPSSSHKRMCTLVVFSLLSPSARVANFEAHPCPDESPDENLDWAHHDVGAASKSQTSFFRLRHSYCRAWQRCSASSRSPGIPSRKR